MSLRSCASVCTCDINDGLLLALPFLFWIPLRFIFCAGKYYYQTKNFQKAHISLMRVLQYVIPEMPVHACGNALNLVTNSANDEST